MKAPESELNVPASVVRWAGWLLFVLCTASLIYLLTRRVGIPTLTPLLEAVYGYGIAVAFILAQIGLGIPFLRLSFFRRLDLQGLPLILFSFVIGFHLSYALLLLLALLPMHTPIALLLYALPGIPAAVFGAFSLGRLGKKWKTAAGFKPDRGKKTIVCAVVLILILWFLPYFAQSVLPNSDWDGDAYHLPQAKRFLESRIIEKQLSFPSYHQPGAIHLVYSFFLAIEAESAVIPLNLLVGLGLVLAVFSLAARFWSRQAGFWAATIWAGCNLLWEVALTPRIDGFLAFFCFMACYGFLIVVHSMDSYSALVPTGIALGTALGIKYTALFVLAVLATGFALYVAADFRLRLRQMTFPAFLALLFVLLPSGFWYGRNLLQTGNPIYHMVTGIIFESSSGERISFTAINPELIASGPSREEQNQIFRSYGLDEFASDFPYRKDPKNLFNFWRIFQKPEYYQRKPYHEINLLLLLFFLLPLVSRKLDSFRLFGLGLFLYLIIGYQTFLLRYALPALPLLAIGAGITMAQIRFRMLKTVLSVILILSCLRFTVVEWNKLAEFQPLIYFSGIGDRLTWLTRVGYNKKTGVPLFIQYVNTQIDKGRFNKADQIFMAGEGKGYRLKCQYEPDVSRFATPWLIELYKAGMDYETVAQQLRSRGIEWIAFNLDYFRVVVEKQTQRREPLLFAFSHLLRFVEKEATVVYQEEDFVLVRLSKETEKKQMQEPMKREPSWLISIDLE